MSTNDNLVNLPSRPPYAKEDMLDYEVIGGGGEV